MNARRDLSLPVAVVILIVATLLVFWPVFTLDFTNWDDGQTVALNPRMNPVTAQSLVYFWTQPHMDLYVPVTYTVWAVTANAARLPPPAPGQPMSKYALDPRVFHGLNLAIHLAGACVAMLLIREFVGSNLAALAGALLFALHPLQVESVAWVSGTKDVLFALLSLIALWQYVRYVKAKSSLTEPMLPGEGARMLGIATVAFVLAMLAKPTAIVVPPIAFVLDVLLLRRRASVALKTLWPWFVLMVPCIVWTKIVQQATQAAGAAPPLYLRPIVALDALAFYLWKLIWPTSGAVDYGRTPAAIIESGAIRWTWIIPTVLIALMLWLAKRNSRLPLAAAVISIIAVGPLLGFVPFAFQAYSTVADHYFYLPMIGPALIVAWVLDRTESRRLLLAVFAIVTVLLAILSHREIPHWRNTQTLFANNLRVSPSSFAANSNLAADALDRSDIGLAIKLSRKAIELNPRDVVPYHTLADAMRAVGNIAAAKSAYRKALECEPDYAPALTNLAAILATQGEFEQALPLFERSARLQPGEVEPQLNLGKLYIQLDRSADARVQLQKVLKLDPRNEQARRLLSALP